MCYHVMSRAMNAEYLFGDEEKEAFRRIMRRMAAFTGVEVMTYAVMSNHFHILIRVPKKQKWMKRFDNDPDQEKLLNHLSILYSKSYLEHLRAELESYRKQGNTEALDQVLGRFRNRLCDVSSFMKELKERFGKWFNRHHDRRGTLWMDRYKSVLVDGPVALRTMAAYIDLNPVRAGLVDDPALYEFTGYSEAVGGSKLAQAGLSSCLGLPKNSSADRVTERYRLFLFDQGMVPDDGHKELRKGVSSAQRQAVRREDGVVNAALLRERTRFFTSGIAMGSKQFTKEAAERHKLALSQKKTRSLKQIQAPESGSTFHVVRE